MLLRKRLGIPKNIRTGHCLKEACDGLIDNAELQKPQSRQNNVKRAMPVYTLCFFGSLIPLFYKIIKTLAVSFSELLSKQEEQHAQ